MERLRFLISYTLVAPIASMALACGGDSHGPPGDDGGPQCARDADCGPGQRCSGRRCVAIGDAGTDAPPGDVGSPCESAADCASGICLPEPMGGTCARPCVDSPDCGSVDALCAPVPVDADGDGEGDTVAAACVSRNDDANFLAGRCSGPGDCASRACVRRQCAEICDSDDDCVRGQVCRDVAYPGIDGATYRGCGYASRSGPLEVTDVPLGELDLVTGTASSRVDFAVPNDAVSLTFVGRRVSGDSVPLAFARLYGPDNRELFDLAGIVGYEDQPIRWLPVRTHESIAMLVPNTTPDRVRFLGGRYGVRTAALAESEGDSREATMELFARVKRARDGSPGSTLDLNVYLVGLGISAGEAPSHGRLQDTLDEVDRILGGAGVTLGSIEYFAIDGSSGLGVIDSSNGPSSEMAELLRMSGPRSNLAANVFFVRSISESAGEGAIALGVSGGVPGPPGVHGTMHSGVLVSFDRDFVSDDYRVPAQVAAHELGHYLGLYHNHEGNPPCGPGETPTPSDPCAPFGGEDVLEDTSYDDDRNLMYYRLGGEGDRYNIRLSDGQGFALTRSALVR